MKKHEQGYGIFGHKINILTSIKLIITKNLSKLWAENYKLAVYVHISVFGSAHNSAFLKWTRPPRMEQLASVYGTPTKPRKFTVR